jgi:hypothetical protein
MRRFRKLLSMDAHDRTLVLEAAASLLIFRVGLHLLRFETLQSWATKAKSTRRSVPISKLIWATMVGTRIVPNSTCLARALAVSRLLARNGYKSTLRVGVRRAGGEFEAHAWVEYGGRAIIGNDEVPHFTPLCTWEK